MHTTETSNHDYIAPLSADEPFPASMECPAGCIEVSLSDDLGVIYESGIVYANRDGIDLHLQVFIPSHDFLGCKGEDEGHKFPLIMYITGSAWKKQNLDQMVPDLCELAKRGYVVASVEYRGTEIAGFPAQIQDAKTAMRFMKKHAETYHVDVTKTAYFGASSGGHTALMAGYTSDGELDSTFYGEYSAVPSAIVDWFGPTDLESIACYPSTMDHVSPDSACGMLIGRKSIPDNPEIVKELNPMNYISSKSGLPATLIMHGDSDAAVPFNQSVRLYEKLRACGKTVQFYKLLGACHGFNGFASKRVYDLVDEFLQKIFFG